MQATLRLITLTLVFCLAAGPTLRVSAQDEALTDVQFPNTSLPVILMEYERITGKRVIRDSSIQEQTLSIQTSGQMTYEEAAIFIEKSMLLNGYALIPTEIPNQVKIVSFTPTRDPGSEGLPIFTENQPLPISDQVITYIMPLNYLTPEAAGELFTAIVPLHSYGKITPLSNATALVITENSSVIRRLIQLRDTVDVSPIKTVDRTFDLERADAEDVVEALADILELDQETAGGTSGDGSNQLASVGGGASSLPSQIRGGGAFTKATTPKPRIRAIPRANRVLVVASPADIEYICRLIEHLDAPVENSSYMQLKLRYLEVEDFLGIASNVILRGREDVSVNESQIGNQNQSSRNTLATTQQTTNNQSSLGSTSSSRGATGDLGNAGLDEAIAPQSIVIDKTLLIADSVQNMLIASGPPEHLRLLENLVQTMDIRPVQIQISAIIAQLNLSDEFEFGFDFLRTLEAPANGQFNGGGSFVSRTGQSRTLLDVTSLTDVANLLPAAQGLTLYGQLNPNLDGFVSALDTTNRFKVLSRPTIYTINNRQAVIETGQRVAVPSSTLSSLDTNQNNANQVVTANIDFVDVVLRVSVVPLINSDGEITLQIQQQNDDIIGSQLIGGNDIPTIGTQTLGTTVMVPDGGTVLLGGLINEEDTKGESGVPLFANLPVVGRVFGSQNDSVQRQELLIFIQPKVIRQRHDQNFADQDLISRTRVGPEAVEFGVREDDNLDLFESQEFNSPEKRIHFFRNIFKKNRGNQSVEPPPVRPTVRAIPVEP